MIAVVAPVQSGVVLTTGLTELVEEWSWSVEAERRRRGEAEVLDARGGSFAAE